MPRQVRIQYPGAMYHVMSRGNRRQRKETTLSVKQIAARLHLGTPGSASVWLLTALRKSIAGTPTQGYLKI